MKTLFLLLLPLCSILPGLAQEAYSFASIPPELLKHASSVVRQYDLKFQVLNKGEGLETEHKVITLINDQAADELDQVFWYDQIRKIEEIEGRVYDSTGKLVRKIRQKDILDQKPFEQNFVNDSRAKLLQFPRLAFPFTIEYTLVSRLNGLMFYPVFEPQNHSFQSVESASFELITPDDLKVRNLEFNVSPGQKTGPLHWEFQNIPAFEHQPFLPLGYTSLPRIMTAPTLFRLEGFDGDMSSWESYGKFIGTLNADKAKLPAETVAKLKQMTADCPDITCKARRVYEFLQNSTRYYFVGLGIGGWQPMPAIDVDKFKYSDCKGLSNYTMAMLQAVGVPAYYALIRAKASEQNVQIQEFPNPWFNHATLCIPTSGEMIWLECTSQTQSFGFLGDFTDNRMALVIYPEGGKIVQTPGYDESVNTILRESKVTLEMDGSANLESNGTFRAIEQDIPSQLSEMPDDQRKKYLYHFMNLSDFEITALSFEVKKDIIPEVNQKLSLHIPKLASVSGKRLFLPVSFLSGKIEIPSSDQPRQHPIQFQSRGKTEEDHLTITIPDGFKIENILNPVSIQSVFGSFELQVQNQNNQIIIHRKLVLNDSVQPKEKFDALLTFLKDIAKADQAKLVLVH
jgi:hypothetical protein